MKEILATAPSLDEYDVRKFRMNDENVKPNRKQITDELHGITTINDEEIILLNSTETLSKQSDVANDDEINETTQNSDRISTK